jgi:hypothetical protein
VADGDGGFAVSHSSAESPVLGGEVGLATLAGCCGALGEDLAEPAAAVGGATGSLFAAGNVVAGADPSPRGEVCCGGEPGHVDADLGDDALGGSFAHSGDRVEPVTGLVERGDHPVDFDVEGGDCPFQIVDVVEDHTQHDGVVVVESAT